MLLVSLTVMLFVFVLFLLLIVVIALTLLVWVNLRPHKEMEVECLNGIKMRVFLRKKRKKSTCAIMIKIIVTFPNQILL